MPAPEISTHRVLLMKDYSVGFPELYMEVWVEGDSIEESRFANMFVKAQCSQAASPEEADLVVFTGGSDVNPALYHEEKHDKTYFNAKRDERDMLLYDLCIREGIPMFGVCRGAQFLHVMNGGSLFQDVNNHEKPHAMHDTRRGVYIGNVSSVHHQMCRPRDDDRMEILATCMESTERWVDNTLSHVGKTKDIEAFFYRDTGCFGVQGHPEYKGYSLYAKWCLDKINELFNENPDFELRNNYRRMKLDLMRERQALMNFNNEENV